MRKRNQLADLRRLISLPPNDLLRHFIDYVYEDSECVLTMVFDLARSGPGRLERKNISSLLKYILEARKELYSSIPVWMVSELEEFIMNPAFSVHEKTVVLSAFDPEELFNRVKAFGRFVQRFLDIKESFEEYIVREIREKRARLYDIFTVMRDKTRYHIVKSMINDLRGSEHAEVLGLLELFTYVENPELSSPAFAAILDSRSERAIPVLKSISGLNPVFSESVPAVKPVLAAAENGINVIEETGKRLDIRVSLADGRGMFSVILGGRIKRNEYFFFNMLFKPGVGIKDVSLFTLLPRSNYRAIKDEYVKQLRLYRVDKKLFRKILNHFIYVGIDNGYGVPVEIIAIKNILNWNWISPEKFRFSLQSIRKIDYHLEDVEKYPFDSWWMNDNIIFNMLMPYEGWDIDKIPDDILLHVSDLYIEYARDRIATSAAICTEIMLNSLPVKGKRMAGLFYTVREEILHPPTNPMDSIFLSFQTINTVHNTICHISSGLKSVEFISR